MKNNYILLLEAISIFLIHQLFYNLIARFIHFVQPDINMEEFGSSLPRLKIILSTNNN